MKKEIDSVRVYQSITFDKRSETFFSTRDINGKSGREITVNEEVGGLEIKSKTDHVIVPYTNISCIYLRSPLKEEQIKNAENAKAKKVGVRAAEIKRPK